MLLDPNRLGRVSMMPPVNKRFINVSRYEMSGAYRDLRAVTGRNIHSARDSGIYKRRYFAGPCEWCTRQNSNDEGELYPYVTAEHNCFFGQDVVWCCCWSCFGQWVMYRTLVQAELDLWFALGVRPEYVPEWYLPRDVYESMCQSVPSYLESAAKRRLVS